MAAIRSSAVLLRQNARTSGKLPWQVSSARLVSSARVLKRYASTPAESSRAAAITQAQQRLMPVFNHLPSDIDWAVAYGSGVIRQANASSSGPAPMTDFLLSVPDPVEFHRENMERNPSHYPSWAPFAPPQFIGETLQNEGAGVWFVTMVEVEGMEIKYGVISTDALKRDLEDWETLYVGGRLQKPVLSLKTTRSIERALARNLESALATSLLVLPSTQPFTEFQLWEQIAGISYSGDPRMMVPGAENPQKVKNIVRGEGNLEGFRDLYKNSVDGLGDQIGWEDGGRLSQWRGSGSDLIKQVDSLDHRASLAASLPLNLRYYLVKAFLPSLLGSARDDLPIPPESKELVRSALSELDQGCWADVVQHDKFRQNLMSGITDIMYRPALEQSAKGLATAGFRKSFHYSLAKFRKWLASRMKE